MTEPTPTCHYGCGTTADLRPYGPGGAMVCYRCANATPQRREAAKGAYDALLEAATTLGGGVVVVGSSAGPQPFDPADLPPPRSGCPLGSHRGPEGPNEDLAQCPLCLSISHMMRPDGEEYGGHLPDCSLPRRHPGRCKPGGDGHPRPDVVRGYFPEEGTP